MRYLVGIGNYMMGDDGIGPRIVEYVADHRLNSDFEVLDLGDNGLNLLSYFDQTTDRMLWVDCVRMGCQPGEFRYFKPEQVESQKYLARRTTHEGDLLKVLEIAQAAGYAIPEIEIMGIEPEQVQQGQGLSEPVAKLFKTYVDEAIRRISSG
ncbi:MAG: hypothetical protein A2070_11810 [Bdellovibrionales bacterium GWC1_52_8]|nr:MAG: hypothetical protein A2Z97_14215 [Bdellovibrionales bacterium GWB1_52_6]OFZ03278.1 MAG: hypothetical protein A2X97_10160 [Bdellovibrionales bacterium GWA1_52_35]OFZ40176.1 MAG: hypothetical protein A2070_11810 [Bdellovibrionales bacterium GWC1_52_8]HCM40536.1 hypothetical protein [Bdellovibrionales bacterium]